MTVSTRQAFTRLPSPDSTRIADGVYELFYSCDSAQAGASDSLLILVRDGRLIGADRWGGLITGHHILDEETGGHRFVVELDVPANGILVTGAQPPAAKRTIELVADLSGAPYNARGRIDLFGAPVSLELVYRGPLALPGDPHRSVER